MPRCTVEEFVAVASGIVVIAAVQLGVMAYLELSGRTIWIITTVQRSLAATVFFYLTYKYCGQPKHVPVRSVGPNGEVRINALANETWALTLLQRIKISFTAVTLAPFRLLGFNLFILLAIVFSLLSTLGLSQKSLKTEPLSRVRLVLRQPVSWCFRGILFCLGFVYIRQKGRRASTAEAPVKVGAPHMSMIEPVAFMCMTLGMFVAEESNFASGPLKWLVQCMQPLLFDRFDAESRAQCGRDQVERATNPKWHNGGSLCVFPEGATHNQRELYVFKTGAFRMGVPVQPVAIRMPFRFMDCSWCTAGPGAASLLLRAMCQFVNFMELHYLPVHIPSEEEKKDARLFANNVQKSIADTLGIPASNHTIEDNKLMDLVRDLVGREDAFRPNIPEQTAAVAVGTRFQFRTANELLGISMKEAKQYLKHFLQHGGTDGLMDFAEFQRTFPSMDLDSQRQMFALMDQDQDGNVEFSEFLVKVALLNERINLDSGKESKTDADAEKDLERFRKAVSLTFDVLAARSKSDVVTTTVLRNLLHTAFPDMDDARVEEFVAEADSDGDGKVNREEFLQFCEAHQDAKAAVRDALFPGVSQIGAVVHEALRNDQKKKEQKALKHAQKKAARLAIKRKKEQRDKEGKKNK